MRRREILSLALSLMVLISSLLMVSGVSAGAQNLHKMQDEEMSVDNSELEFVPGEILVKFKLPTAKQVTHVKDGVLTTGVRSLDRLNDLFEVIEMERVFPSSTSALSNVFKLKVPKETDIVHMAQIYAADPNVEYAEPNILYHTLVVPNDPSYPQQWAHQNIESELAWDIETGDASVVVAIVDTGVDWDHPDLAANIWNNTDEIPENGIDDDNNGFVDDVRGWDFVDVPPEYPPMVQPAPGEDGTERDNDPMDFHGHGTHCSGIAGAVTDNSVGIAGTCWNIQIMPVRAGYLAQAGVGVLLNEDSAAAIEYAADNGAHVISMSWGGSGISDVIKDAIDYASDLGVVLVGAAGNDYSKSRSYPASYDEVISVAASTSGDGKASFSNYGSWVDVSAPGVDIYSTLFDDTYESWSGTSMATPFVAGLAGLILSKDSSFTNEEVRNILRSTTDSVTSSVYIGLGRINAYQAILRDTILIANLHSDLDEATIYGTTDITGTASGPYFQYYKVEYGLGIYPTSWTQIGPTYFTPVTNSTLATWDTSGTIEGIHTIKLTAVGLDGQTTVDMAVLTVDNSYITYPVGSDFLRAGDVMTITGTATGPGFQRYILEYGEGSSPTTWTSDGIVLANGGTVPVVEGDLATWDTSVITQANYYTLRLTVFLGGYNGTGSVTIVLDPDYQVGWPKKVPYRLVSTSVAVSDIDGDGDLELIAGETGFGMPYGRSVYAWHHDGTDVTGWPKTNVATECITSSPALGDIDSDGDLEIFVGTDGGQVEAWHHDGSVVAGWPVTTGSNIQSSPALGDIDADGDLEVVVGSWNGYVYAWHHDGSSVTGWPKATGDTVISSPALGDIDGDGDLEIVVGSDDYKVYAWHHDGSMVTGWPRATSYYVESSPALGDIDDDGDLEIIVGSWDGYVYAWHHDGTDVTGWPKPVDGWALSSPALGDIDGDADIEVVYGSWHGIIYAWHHDGTSVTGWPIDFASNLWPGASPVLGDIDGDLDIEILVASNRLFAWHHDGSTVTDFPRIIPTGAQWWFTYAEGSSPVLADLDEDGDIEIVLGDEGIFGGEGHLFVWDLTATYRPAAMEWPMFHHEKEHTGLYVPRRPSLTVLAEDQCGNPITDADVYIDGQLVGYVGSTFEITVGYHEVFVNDFWESGTTDCRYGFAHWNDYSTGNKTIQVVEDTTLTASFVKWYCPGDVDGSGVVDDTDLDIASNAYGTRRGDAGWDSRADITRDLLVDIRDIVRVAINYGEEYWVSLIVNARDQYCCSISCAEVWIDDQFVGYTGSTFTVHPGPRKVYVESTFWVGNWLYIFEHWEDCSTRNPRIAYVDSTKTITAYYWRNSPPIQPSTPSGPSSGYKYSTYTYSTSATDPDGDNVRYQFDWDDGTTTTTGWYASGVTASASHSWSSTGTFYVKVRAQDSYGAWSNWSSSRTVSISSGGGGCPILYVYDGNDYVCEGLLDIHNPNGTDVIYEHTLITTPERVGNAYLLCLVEHPQTHSYIDQVKLYAILEDETIVELRLKSAVHSEYGKVLRQLLFSDDWKAETVGADHNNGTSQSIDLKFVAPNINTEVIGFIFQIEGNNPYHKLIC